MNELETLTNDLAQALVLSRCVPLPLEWGVWPLSTRFGWVSQVTGALEQALLKPVEVGAC